MSETKIIKCAIYTRKSSEEGLEQDFNSLQAQREACEAYIKSQKHEHWQLIPNEYNDGGYSGGTLERPALKALLTDVSQGKVDIIVIYKIDRLTRSLMDFSKIVEVLDKDNASFVSITQNFNTTTSMGRLTLNMLLSFAQFERELTGERIRDKYLASKQKGMWMGGKPPMGYYRKDKKLYPCPNNINSINTIFDKYIEFKSVEKVKDYLDKNDIKSQNGLNLSKGNITSILVNRAYIGEVGHKGKWYKGLHEAIIEQETFDKAEEIFKENRVIRNTISASNSFLSGKLFDDKNNYMSPSHSRGKLGKKYRYYVSQAVIRNENNKIGDITKISANTIEIFMDKWIYDIFNDEKELHNFITDFPAEKQKTLLKLVKEYSFNREIERILINKVILNKNEIKLIIYKEQIIEFLISLYENRKCNTLTNELLKKELLFNKEYKLSVVDNGAKIIIGDIKNIKQEQKETLVRAVLTAHRWSKMLLSGEVKSILEIAKKEHLNDSYISHRLNLVFLPTQLTIDILEGKQSKDLTIKTLIDKYCF